MGIFSREVAKIGWLGKMTKNGLLWGWISKDQNPYKNWFIYNLVPRVLSLLSISIHYTSPYTQYLYWICHVTMLLEHGGRCSTNETHSRSHCRGLAKQLSSPWSRKAVVTVHWRVLGQGWIKFNREENIGHSFQISEEALGMPFRTCGRR